MNERIAHVWDVDDMSDCLGVHGCVSILYRQRCCVSGDEERSRGGVVTLTGLDLLVWFDEDRWFMATNTNSTAFKLASSSVPLAGSAGNSSSSVYHLSLPRHTSSS